MMAWSRRVKVVSPRLFLAVLMAGYSVSNTLYANERVRQDEFVQANETRHQWVNERNGRAGMLMVTGELLSSPCTLETNEIDLQQEMQPEGMLERYKVKVNLAGCGDGDTQRQTGLNKIITTQSALLYNREGGLQPEEQMVSNGKVVLHHGRNQLLYYLNKNQRQALTSQHVSEHMQITPLMSSSLLHLILGYE